MTKSELRKTYLAKQKDLPSDKRAEKSRQITDQFFQRFDLGQIKVIHCFISIEKFNEIDTTFLFQRLWKDFPHIETLVPRVNFGTGEIENLKFAPGTDLVQNVWKIHEPIHDEYVETRKIDMVLVPLLCFDRLGYRVGYGKGFYDRFLGKCRADCVKVGLSYFPPVTEITLTGTHDVALDFCVTPDDVFSFGKN